MARRRWGSGRIVLVCIIKRGGVLSDGCFRFVAGDRRPDGYPAVHSCTSRPRGDGGSLYGPLFAACTSDRGIGSTFADLLGSGFPAYRDQCLFRTMYPYRNVERVSACRSKIIIWEVDDHGRLSLNPETIKSQLLSNPDCAGTSLLVKYNPGSRETGYRERDKVASRRGTHQPTAL